MLEAGSLMFRCETARGKCFMGAQSHWWFIAHLLDIPNQSCLWKVGGFVVLVQVTKPILLMPALFRGWKLFCNGFGTSKLSRDNPRELWASMLLVCRLSSGFQWNEQSVSSLSDAVMCLLCHKLQKPEYVADLECKLSHTCKTVFTLHLNFPSVWQHVKKKAC